MDEAVLDYKEKYQSACIEIINLRHELDQLRRLVFGSRHERFIANTPPEQLALDLTAETVQAAPVPVQAIEYTRQRRKEKTEKVQTGRMKLPADLPREQVILEPEGDALATGNTI